MAARHGIDILIIGDDDILFMALQEAGFSVATTPEDSDLYRAVAEWRPCAILLHADSPSRDTLEHLASLSRRYPQPTLLLHDGRDAELSRRALDMGISAYVADGMSAAAVKALIDVSIRHHQQLDTLRKELARSQSRLAERKLVDAAKCSLMETGGLSEDDAYRALKTRAMNARISLGEAARALLEQLGRRP